MEVTSNSRLLTFFIFNSNYSKREGEEEKKILFYYPSKTNIDDQIRSVGLCEAIIKFTGTFTTSPCEVIHTQHTRKIFLEAAPEFWMVMTISVPHYQRVQDGTDTIEFKEDDVQNMVCKSVLSQSYDMFKLFMGPIESIMKKTDIKGLKQRFEHFFNRYVYSINLDTTDIVDVFDGLQFMPLDKSTFLRVQCYVNQIEASFPNVKYSAFFFNDNLVWCGLDPNDMRVVYRYLTTSLFPAHPDLDVTSVSTSSKHMGRFIAGPPDLTDKGNMGKIPKLYLTGKTGEIEVCTLVVYRALRASICLFMDSSTKVSFDYYISLDKHLGPELTSLAESIASSNAKAAIVPDDCKYRYIYYNHMNMALKSTLHPEGPRKSANTAVPPVMMRSIVDIKFEIDKYLCTEHCEIVAKANNESWVVAKKADKREVYIVLTHKTANLIQVHEEAKQVCSSQFSNIFFMD